MCQRVWAQGGMKSWPFLQPLTLAPLLASSSLGTEAWTSFSLHACGMDVWPNCGAFSLFLERTSSWPISMPLTFPRITAPSHFHSRSAVRSLRSILQLPF